MTYFFIHTPKTSGTTFVDVLSRDPRNDIGYFYPSSGEVYDFEKTIKSRPYDHKEANPDWQRFNFIVGHYTYGMHQVLEAEHFRYIGTIREPVSHFISTYKAMMRLSSPYRDHLLGEGSEHTIEELLAKPFAQNLQTFFLSGLSLAEIHEDKERAYRVCIDNFDRYFDGFCITERFDESMHLLARKNILRPMYYRRKNVATNSLMAPPAPKLIDSILAANDIDARLYRHVMMRFKDESRKFHSLGLQVSLFKAGNVLNGIFAKT